MRILASVVFAATLVAPVAWAADAVVDPGFGPAVHNDDSLDEQVAFVNERIATGDMVVAVAEETVESAVTDASFNALPSLYQVAALPDEE